MNDVTPFELFVLIAFICFVAAYPILLIAAVVSKPPPSSRSGSGFVE